MLWYSLLLLISESIYNKEKIDLSVDLDTYGVGIRDINNVISGTKIIYTGTTSPSNGLEIFLKTGYLMNKNFNNSVKVVKKISSSKKYQETKTLMLNSEKSKKILKWKAKYNLEQTAQLISFWFKAFFAKKNILTVTQKQIINYFD